MSQKTVNSPKKNFKLNSLTRCETTGLHKVESRARPVYAVTAGFEEFSCCQLRKAPRVAADEDDAGRAEQDCDSEPFFTAKFKLALLCFYLSKTSINTHFYWTGLCQRMTAAIREALLSRSNCS